MTQDMMQVLFKPPQFKATKTGDSEQLLQNFTAYKDNFLKFLTATNSVTIEEVRSPKSSRKNVKRRAFLALYCIETSRLTRVRLVLLLIVELVNLLLGSNGKNSKTAVLKKSKIY